MALAAFCSASSEGLVPWIPKRAGGWLGRSISARSDQPTMAKANSREFVVVGSNDLHESDVIKPDAINALAHQVCAESELCAQSGVGDRAHK
jgi:hypothetical protein